MTSFQPDAALMELLYGPAEDGRFGAASLACSERRREVGPGSVAGCAVIVPAAWNRVDVDEIREGTEDDDVLFGDDGEDVLAGNGGNDVLHGAGGADRLDGGAGTDTVSYVGSGRGVIVELGSGRGFGGDAEGDELV
ncbi:hypothetical protein KXS07_37055, partial [Inquilinus limosus]